MSEKFPQGNEGIPREALMLKINRLLTSYPGDYVTFSEGESFMNLSLEEKRAVVRQVLGGLRENVQDMDGKKNIKIITLNIDSKRKELAYEAVEAGILSPEEAEELIS